MLQIIVLALLQQGPAMARELVALFQKKDPTPADWEKVFAHYKTPYSDYVGTDILAQAQALVAAGKGDTKVSPTNPPQSSP